METVLSKLPSSPAGEGKIRTPHLKPSAAEFMFSDSAKVRHRSQYFFNVIRVMPQMLARMERAIIQTDAPLGAAASQITPMTRAKIPRIRRILPINCMRDTGRLFMIPPFPPVTLPVLRQVWPCDGWPEPEISGCASGKSNPDTAFLSYTIPPEKTSADLPAVEEKSFTVTFAQIWN